MGSGEFEGERGRALPSATAGTRSKAKKGSIRGERAAMEGWKEGMPSMWTGLIGSEWHGSGETGLRSGGRGRGRGRGAGDWGSGEGGGGEVLGGVRAVLPNLRRCFDRGMRGPPVVLQELRQVLARVLQLVLVQDDVEGLLQSHPPPFPSLPSPAPGEGIGDPHGRALSELLGSDHLDVHVPSLGLPAGLDEALQNLTRPPILSRASGGKQAGPWAKIS